MGRTPLSDPKSRSDRCATSKHFAYYGPPQQIVQARYPSAGPGKRQEELDAAHAWHPPWLTEEVCRINVLLAESAKSAFRPDCFRKRHGEGVHSLASSAFPPLAGRGPVPELGLDEAESVRRHAERRGSRNSRVQSRPRRNSEHPETEEHSAQKTSREAPRRT